MSEIPSKENVSNTQREEASVAELKDEEVKQVVSQVIREIQFSGPIPPPNIINEYEKILPGSADRILAMAEKQSKHRQTMEKMMIQAESRDSLLGILFGFLLGIGCVVAAIVMSIVYPSSAGVISGAVLGGAGVTSIAITAIKSTKRGKQSSDNNEDDE